MKIMIKFSILLILLITVLVGAVFSTYTFNSTITLKKKTFSNSYWVSNGFDIPGYLIYAVKSMDNKSKINTLILSKYNCLKYEKNEAYTYYTDFSKFGTILASINKTYFNQDDVLYLVVENGNLLSNADVKILIVYQKVEFPKTVTPDTSVSINSSLLILIIILVMFILLVIAITVITICKKRQNEYTELLK